MVVNNANLTAFDPLKALFTDACRRHFDEYPRQAEWQGRTYHLVIGFLEAIPIIGQIVSLLELGIISFYTGKPELDGGELQIPLRLLAQNNAPSAARQKTPADQSLLAAPQTCRPPTQLRFAYPDSRCLSILGLTRDDIATLESALRPEGFSGSMVFRKRSVEQIGADKVSRIVQLPVTIFESDATNNESKEYIIISKKIAFNGAERKVRWAYSLTSGELLVKKRIVGLLEETTIKELALLRQKRNIPSKHFWRGGKDKAGEKKRQLLEPLKDGTISILFGTRALQEFSTKRSVIVDLLEDLGDFQSISFSGIKMSCKGFLDRELPQYFAFHQDIKWDNILVFQQGRWRAEMCDFGSGASVPNKVFSSNGFVSPEYLYLLDKTVKQLVSMNRLDQQKFLVDFQLKNGQKRDMWAMGLIILGLLVGRLETVNYPKRQNLVDNTVSGGTLYAAPLTCVNRAIQAKAGVNSDPNLQDIGLLDVTQQEVDDDLNSLEREVKLKHPNEPDVPKLFKMIRDMIRINPDERKLAKEILKYLT